MSVIAVYNTKGGVANTCEMARVLSEDVASGGLGLRVLVVDFDPNTRLTSELMAPIFNGHSLVNPLFKAHCDETPKIRKTVSGMLSDYSLDAPPGPALLSRDRALLAKETIPLPVRPEVMKRWGKELNAMEDEAHRSVIDEHVDEEPVDMFRRIYKRYEDAVAARFNSDFFNYEMYGLPVTDPEFVDDPTRYHESAECSRLFILPGDADSCLTLAGMNQWCTRALYEPEECGYVCSLLLRSGGVLRNVAERYNIDIILLAMDYSTNALNQTLLITSDYFVVPYSIDCSAASTIKSLGATMPRWLEEISGLLKCGVYAKFLCAFGVHGHQSDAVRGLRPSHVLLWRTIREAVKRMIINFQSCGLVSEGVARAIAREEEPDMIYVPEALPGIKLAYQGICGRMLMNFRPEHLDRLSRNPAFDRTRVVMWSTMTLESDHGIIGPADDESTEDPTLVHYTGDGIERILKMHFSVIPPSGPFIYPLIRLQTAEADLLGKKRRIEEGLLVYLEEKMELVDRVWVLAPVRVNGKLSLLEVIGRAGMPKEFIHYTFHNELVPDIGFGYGCAVKRAPVFIIRDITEHPENRPVWVVQLALHLHGFAGDLYRTARSIHELIPTHRLGDVRYVDEMGHPVPVNEQIIERPPPALPLVGRRRILVTGVDEDEPSMKRRKGV